ncbi:MaoC family dehydratase [Aeromicrobium sp. YIM 150415]|uniref:MaoC family dehydratase n=1 Tax=Aeromicrobium sp. YIM 150415 TaxID=2803912 RepID=UPI0019631928|nr:MaoC family dehydratase [Aeromicrobium sp. YIM 150415]MBM9463469.1 MaoC family dehydratase [Aeromicrobium sp. YIM 150415]
MYDENNSVWNTTFRGKAPEVGETAERTRTITQADVDAFAQASGDYNPLHFDDEFVADSTMFEGRISHGGLIIGAISEVGAEDLPGPGSVFLSVNWRFVAPVYIPDEVTSRVEVLEVRHDKPIAKLRQTVTRSDGQIVLDGEVLTYMSPRHSLQPAQD